MSGEVITAVELLSPTNKRPGEGPAQYEAKRRAVLRLRTHLVEIDLIRAYEPMLVYGNGHHSHYRILVSRSNRRPQADLYGFNVQDRSQPSPFHCAKATRNRSWTVG